MQFFKFFVSKTQLCRFTLNIPNSALDINEIYETHAILDPYDALLLVETLRENIDASEISSLFFKALQSNTKKFNTGIFCIIRNCGKNVNSI